MGRPQTQSARNLAAWALFSNLTLNPLRHIASAIKPLPAPCILLTDSAIFPLALVTDARYICLTSKGDRQMTDEAKLTRADEADLLTRGATVHFNRATLQVRWVPMAGIAGLGSGAMPKERRFVMEGPSGRHSLLVDATDLDRLNAHWQVFCADQRNACA